MFLWFFWSSLQIFLKFLAFLKFFCFFLKFYGVLPRFFLHGWPFASGLRVAVHVPFNKRVHNMLWKKILYNFISWTSCWDFLQHSHLALSIPCPTVSSSGIPVRKGCEKGIVLIVATLIEWVKRCARGMGHSVWKMAVNILRNTKADSNLLSAVNHASHRPTHVERSNFKRLNS